MFKSKYISVALLALGGISSSILHAATLQVLSDDQLSNTTGQALMSLSYLAPSDSTNLEAQRNGGDKTIGFYKLGLEAELAINANIKKLQLGCGGANGAGKCDIDIDNLSLSGLGNTITSNNATDADRTARVSSDATITNPFIQFAIKDPQSASTRSVVGVRLSAEKIVGLLTTGTENTSTANGINTLSGYIPVRSDSSGLIKGTVNTAASYFDASDTNNKISGTLEALGGGLLGATAKFHLASGGFWVPAFTNVGFTVPGFTLKGNRISSLSLNPIVQLPDLVMGRDFNNNNCGALGTSGACNTYGLSSGFTVKPSYNVNSTTASDGNGNITSYISALSMVGVQGGVATSTQADSDQNLHSTLLSKVDSCSGASCLLAKDQYYVNMYSKVTGVKTNVSVNQPLGLVHSLKLNSSTSLSLQSTTLQWPGQPSDDIAQKGWWLSVKDGVDLGTIIPTESVNLCAGGTGNSAQCVHPQIASQINAYLSQTVLKTNDLSGLLNGNKALSIQVGNIALTPLNLGINGLVLNNQYFAPNCYGSLKFC